MKGFMIGCVLFSGLAQAQTLSVNVSNFNFSYQDPFGEGSATSFSRTEALEAVQVRVEKQDKDFLLMTTGAEEQEFTFKDAPSFMIEAETMSIKGFNLNLKETFALNLGSGRFYSRDDSLKLDNLNLSCARDVTQSEEMDQLISGCIKKMSLKSSKFSSESAKKSFLNVLENAMLVTGIDKADLGVNDLDLKTQNGKYELQGEVKAQISGKVKSHGNMNYDPAKGTLTVKISEVKFGLFNVTGKVFDELEKNESEKLQVKKPYIYYTIK